jgi:hypothetical protein
MLIIIMLSVNIVTLSIVMGVVMLSVLILSLLSGYTERLYAECRFVVCLGAAKID